MTRNPLALLVFLPAVLVTACAMWTASPDVHHAPPAAHASKPPETANQVLDRVSARLDCVPPQYNAAASDWPGAARAVTCDPRNPPADLSDRTFASLYVATFATTADQKRYGNTAARSAYGAQLWGNRWIVACFQAGGTDDPSARTILAELRDRLREGEIR